MDSLPQHLMRCPRCACLWDLGSSTPLSMVCLQSHSFDIARQGYVNFLAGSGTRFKSDSPQMILARERFQDAGFYAPLKSRLADLIRGDLLDAGCGTGYYAEGAPYSRLLAMDLSRNAVQRAARLPRTCAFVGDLWQPLPIQDAVCDTVVNVFAPHNFPEFRRILRPGGRIVVVTAGDGHLQTLRKAGLLLGQGRGKLAELDEKAQMPVNLREQLRLPLVLTLENAVDLAFMGPAGHHASREVLESRLPQGLDAVETEAVFDISVYAPM